MDYDVELKLRGTFLNNYQYIIIIFTWRRMTHILPLHGRGCSPAGHCAFLVLTWY